jgi:hypothetical protein
MYNKEEYTDVCCRELITILDEFKLWFEKEFEFECSVYGYELTANELIPAITLSFQKYYTDYTAIIGGAYIGDQYQKDSSFQGILFKKIVALNRGYMKCSQIRKRIEKDKNKKEEEKKKKEEEEKKEKKEEEEIKKKIKEITDKQNEYELSIKNAIKTGEYDKILFEHNGKQYELKLYNLSEHKYTQDHFVAFILSQSFQEQIIVRLRTINGYTTHNIRFPTNLYVCSIEYNVINDYYNTLLKNGKININIRNVFDFNHIINSMLPYMKKKFPTLMPMKVEKTYILPIPSAPPPPKKANGGAGVDEDPSNV